MAGRASSAGAAAVEAGRAAIGAGSASGRAHGGPVIFASAGLRAIPLEAPDLPALQAFFVENPEYFRAINGRDPFPDEAQAEFDERPPAGMPFRERWFLGLYDDAGELAGHAGVLADLLAPSVWHIGLFMLASRLHGTGLAAAAHVALETWAQTGGAQWMRLGVVAGNAKAERFWAKLGYREVRIRHGIDTGGRINDIRVLVKPLLGQSLATYFELVPRDRPGAP